MIQFIGSHVLDDVEKPSIIVIVSLHYSIVLPDSFLSISLLEHPPCLLIFHKTDIAWVLDFSLNLPVFKCFPQS